MALPSLDLEMTYWRMRRRAMRSTATFHNAVARVRSAIQLHYLRRLGKLPHQLEPEETFAWRLMWAIVIVGLGAVLVMESCGPEKYWSLPQGVTERAVVNGHVPRKDVTQEQGATERSTDQQKGEQG
jgi:hypothetical protein